MLELLRGNRAGQYPIHNNRQLGSLFVYKKTVEPGSDLCLVAWIQLPP